MLAVQGGYTLHTVHTYTYSIYSSKFKVRSLSMGRMTGGDGGGLSDVVLCGMMDFSFMGVD